MTRHSWSLKQISHKHFQLGRKLVSAILTRGMTKSRVFDKGYTVTSRSSIYLFTFLLPYMHFISSNYFWYTQDTNVYIETSLLQVRQKELFWKKNKQSFGTKMLTLTCYCSKKSKILRDKKTLLKAVLYYGFLVVSKKWVRENEQRIKERQK